MDDSLRKVMPRVTDMQVMLVCVCYEFLHVLGLTISAPHGWNTIFQR